MWEWEKDIFKFSEFLSCIRLILIDSTFDQKKGYVEIIGYVEIKIICLFLPDSIYVFKKTNNTFYHTGNKIPYDNYLLIKSVPLLDMVCWGHTCSSPPLSTDSQPSSSSQQ